MTVVKSVSLGSSQIITGIKKVKVELLLGVILHLKSNLTSLFLLQGVEDGQTVRMPVGKKEVFITFRVSVFVNKPRLQMN